MKAIISPFRRDRISSSWPPAHAPRPSPCPTETTPETENINDMLKNNFLRKGNRWLPKIQAWVNAHGGGQIIPMSCEFEQELMDLNDDADAKQGKSIQG